MTEQQQTVRSVVGENVRRLREDAGARQDDVATAARAAGLAWSRSKVAAVERGDKAIDVAELVVLAEVMAKVTKTPVALPDLFSGAGGVVLSDRLTVKRAAMRRVLAGAPVRFAGRPIVDGVAEAMGRVQRSLERMIALGGDEVDVNLVGRLAARSGEAEERAARALGVDRHDLAALSAGLWGRSLSEERDRRAGQDGSARTLQAVRGRVARVLLEELRERLQEVGG